MFDHFVQVSQCHFFFGGGDDVATRQIWDLPGPSPIAPKDRIPREGPPHLYIYKPPLIKWPYKHKLWENLETAAFNPKLLQIGWPPEPICKESLPKWPPEGHSPQLSRGGGGVAMSVWAHCWALVLDAFFGMLFQMQFLSLRTLFWSLWAPILDHFGLLFCSFQLSK